MASPPPVVHAIAGSIGGAVATFLLYPLELIRSEIQARGNNGKEASSDDQSASGGKCSRIYNHVHHVPLPFENEDEDASSSSSGSAITMECDVSQSDDSKNDASSSSSTLPETNLQCFLRLYKQKSLYRGASSMVTTLMISNFLFFYTLQVTRKILLNLQQQQHSSSSSHYRNRPQRSGILSLVRHLKFLQFLLPKSSMGNSLLASSLAGVINVFLTTPLWVGTRRIMESPESFMMKDDSSVSHLCSEKDKVLLLHKQRQKQPNLWNVMNQISQKEGTLQLWNGTWSSLLLVSNPAIQYFLYEQVRLWLLARKSGKDRRLNNGGGQHGNRPRPGGGSGSSNNTMALTPMEAFVFGAMAKTVATVITYPLQLAQVLIRLRINEVNDNAASSPSMTGSEVETINVTSSTRAYKGVADCLYEQFKRGGVVSLFTGMNSKLLQTVLSAAFTFLTYEQTLLLVGKIYESSLVVR